MAFKMKELIAKSGENRSTILYYLKEGLLPEPSRPKPNVHLYKESSVEIIKFIKYLQRSFSYTIADIKQLFDQTSLNLDGSFEMMVSALEIATIGRGALWCNRETLLQKTGISEETLRSYIDKGYIFARKQGFSATEVEMILILKNLTSLGLEHSLIDQYVRSVREIAELEIGAGSRMFDAAKEETAGHYELLFDVVLKLKPYIYNMHTASQYYYEKEIQA